MWRPGRSSGPSSPCLRLHLRDHSAVRHAEGRCRAPPAMSFTRCGGCGLAPLDATMRAVESALGRALRLRSARPDEFAKLAANCMGADYSWARPGQEYLDIYQHIRHKLSA